MPRYFFDVDSIGRSIDSEGSELPSDADAHREAVALAGAIIQDQAADFPGPGESWRFVVRAEDGERLFDFRFCAQPRSGSLEG